MMRWSKVVFIDTKDKVPRKFSISKRDAMKFGYTKCKNKVLTFKHLQITSPKWSEKCFFVYDFNSRRQTDDLDVFVG